MQTNKFELLAPAGSFEIFKAVIEAGADAVYVGGDMFGARAYANNFSKEELLGAIDYAHLRNKKLYLTVNTLLKNQEISGSLYEYLLPFYQNGLDAVLVQDFGCLNFIHEHFPDLPIHTSTQMTVTGKNGIELLKSYGVERVVMAREVSISEMKVLHEQTGMELEAFVHGALCYCYSGQCLMSSIIGGRSGNRGRCAQPCRLPYSIFDGKKLLDKESYILSLKDMCGIEALPLLNQAGVYSLKIEGRMKQASYAAGVVSIYRKYIDKYMENPESFSVSKEDMKHLMDLGNRCGFTDSYYHRHNNSDMITYVKPNYATDNEKYHQELLDKYVNAESRLPISGFATIRQNQPIEFEISYQGIQAKAYGIEGMEAKNKPSAKEDIISRLSKTGQTEFEFYKIDADVEDNVFVPNGALNQLRRDAIDALYGKLLAKYKRDKQKEFIQDVPSSVKAGRETEYVASVETLSQLEALLACTYISEIYVDYTAFDKKNFKQEVEATFKDIKKAGKKGFLILPWIIRNDTQEFLDRNISFFKEADIEGFLVKNYEGIKFVKDNFKEKKIISDYNMYTYNNYAKDGFMKLGIEEDTIPLELNYGEIAKRNNIKSQILAYGFYPIMVTAGCVHKNVSGCDKEQGLLYLSDRYDKKFPVRNKCSECYNIIYNSLPTNLLGEVSKLEKCNICKFRFAFTIESSDQIKDILKSFEQGKAIITFEEFTKGHYKRGVE